MTPYERRRAWALSHPERIRASRRNSARRRRAALAALRPDFRLPEYELTKFKRATQENT